jgi:hypothetical protein
VELAQEHDEIVRDRFAERVVIDRAQRPAEVA